MRKLHLTLLLSLFAVTTFAQYNMCLGDYQELCPYENVTISTCITNPAPLINNDSLLIVGGLSTLVQTDDIYSGLINIGFPFTFYGNTYNNCVISSNGYISFNNFYAGGYSPWAIGQAAPSPGLPLNSIFGVYQDIDPTLGGIIQYGTVGTAPDRIFVVRFLRVPYYGGACSQNEYCGSILLYENGNRIETHIKYRNFCTGWNGGQGIHGLQNSTGSAADIVSGRNFGNLWTAYDDGYEFIDNGGLYSINPIQYKKVIDPSLMIDSTYTADSIRWYSTEGDLVGYGPTYTYNPLTYAFNPLPLGDTIGFYPVLPIPADSNLNCDGDVLIACGPPATVHVNPMPNPVLIPTDITCNNPVGMLMDINDPGCTFVWSDGQTGNPAMFPFPGFYSVTVTNSAGCTASAGAPVQEFFFAASATGVDESCNAANGTASVIINGNSLNYTYQWSANANGQTTATITNLAAGLYEVTVTDLFGCTDTASVTLINTGTTPPPTSNTPITYCLNAPASALTATGSNLTFYDAATGGNVIPQPIVPSTATAGTQSYWVTQTINTCESTRLLIEVVVSNPPTINLGSADTIVCENENATISVVAVGNNNYSWSVSSGSIVTGANSPDVEVSLPAAGSYTATVVVTDNNTCTSSATYGISVLVAPLIAVTAADTVVCTDEFASISIAPIANCTYSWSIQSPGLIVNGAASPTVDFDMPIFGNYTATLVVTNSNNCSATANFGITVYDLPFPGISFADSLICEGSSVTLTALGIGNAVWNTGETASSITVTQGGEYWVLVENNGCFSDTAYQNITVLPYIYPEITTADTTIGSGEFVQLDVINSAGNSSLSYIWTPQSELSCTNCNNPTATPFETAEYFVTLDYQCTGSDSITITISDPEFFAIPNAFTPNGDNRNDGFGVITKGKTKVTQFKVFDRWGEIVFSDPSGMWNGEYRGKQMPAGVYIYSVEIQVNDTDKKQLMGSVTLLR
jgi:gliding motility-associated-like protein